MSMWRLLEDVADAGVEVPQVEEAPKEPAFNLKAKRPGIPRDLARLTSKSPGKSPDSNAPKRES